MKDKVRDAILMVVIILWAIVIVVCAEDHYADYNNDIHKQIMMEPLAL